MSRHFMRDLVWHSFTSGFGWPFPKVTGDPSDESLEFTVVDEDWGGPVDGSRIQQPRELVNMAEALVDGEEPDEPEPKHSGNYIRILELLPGNYKDELHCNLKIHNLDNCPEYEALSYCWGDDKDTTPINVERGILEVTKNLYHALLHLRRKSKPRLLWIDAVCINQQDLDERTSQVQLMRHIYRQATRTVVWLGLAYDESRLALLTCFKLAREGELAQREINPPYSHLQAIESCVKGTVVTDRERDAIVGLVQRTWFQRIWVVQEVGVAKDAIVVCGWREIHWSTLSLGINYGLFIDQLNIAQLGVVTTPDFVNFAAIATINSRESDRPPAEQLLDLLMKFRTRDAKDPRDKVFSLLGLVEGELGVIPDYSSDCTAIKIYTQTTAAIIKGSGNLDILGLCPTALKSDLVTVLPTWVADWSFTKFLPKPFTIETTDRKRTTHSSRCIKVLPEFLDENSVLVISGHTVDFVSELGDVLHDIADNGFFEEEELVADANSTTEEGFRGAWQEFKGAGNIAAYATSEILRIVTHLEIFVRWEKLARIDKKSAIPTPTGEDDTAVYWQTLCSGRMPEGYATTQKQYEEWYSSLNSVRRLVKLRVNKVPNLFKPLAFAGYVKSTWETYGKFGSLMQHANGRRLARTKRGYLCLVPAGSQVNDAIVLCTGGKVPLVARVQDGYWRFVGESYVHGLMDGEAFDPDACEKMLFK